MPFIEEERSSGTWAGSVISAQLSVIADPEAVASTNGRDIELPCDVL